MREGYSDFLPSSSTKQPVDYPCCYQVVTTPWTAPVSGTVKWFNETKGFGFIAPDEGGKDVFVHISAVERSGLRGLADDQKIEYELQAGRDGRESAVNLTLLS